MFRYAPRMPGRPSSSLPATGPGRAVKKGVAVALLAALALLVSGCLQDAPAGPQTPAPTPIGELRTDSVVVERAPFCDKVPDRAVEDAIGGELSDSQQWGEGDRADTGDTAHDVANELGCSWSSADGVTARAWVFARPVTKAFATSVATDKPKNQVCRNLPRQRFGSPSQLQVCQLGGGVLRVRRAGLFGDSWLACEIAAPVAKPGALRKRVDAWCVEVVNAVAVS